MPATTSALMALRLSGRLMVIQNACPRFSRITLLVSVIVPLACLPLLASIFGRMPVDCKRELGRGRGLLHPHLVVMERRATDGSNGLGPGQHVDAAAADMGLVRMDGISDQNAAAYTVKYLHGQCGFTPNVAERHRIAIGDGKA